MKRCIKFIMLCFILILAIIPCLASSLRYDTGSISVEYIMEKNSQVSGIDVTLYRVGDVLSDNSYVLDNEILKSDSSLKIDFNDEKSLKELPKKLETIVVNKFSSLRKSKTDASGKIDWYDLDIGIYLVSPADWSIRDSKTKELIKYDVLPILVTIPYTDINDNSKSYSIVVDLKHEKLASPTPSPTSPPRPNRLPQTGTLRWPIPILGIGGLSVCVLGLAFEIGLSKNEEERKRHIWCKVVQYLGVFSLACSILLGLYNTSKDIEAKKNSDDVLSQLTSEVSSISSNISDIVHEDIISDSVYEEHYKTINGINYIGKLNISQFNLELPVISEWNDVNADIAPCRYYGSISDSNIIIAAHNYSSHFGKIGTLDIDSTIVFTDVDGNKFEYRVEKIETLNGLDVDGMIDNDYDLTLFTCDYSGYERITVRCSLAEN